MSFKLAFKNMKKNMKDYVIYFITLVLGVAIFYIFNSMEAQQAALSMSESKQQIIELMVQALGIVSGFVTVVLGFLIVYAKRLELNVNFVREKQQLLMKVKELNFQHIQQDV